MKYCEEGFFSISIAQQSQLYASCSSNLYAIARLVPSLLIAIILSG